jgi:hypothetical protein
LLSIGLLVWVAFLSKEYHRDSDCPQLIQLIDMLSPYTGAADVASRPASGIVAHAKQSVILGSTTLYEGGLQVALKMGGLQKLTYVSTLGSEFASSASFGEPVDAAAHVHPALYATLPAAIPAAGGKAAKKAAAASASSAA